MKHEAVSIYSMARRQALVFDTDTPACNEAVITQITRCIFSSLYENPAQGKQAVCFLLKLSLCHTSSSLQPSAVNALALLHVTSNSRASSACKGELQLLQQFCDEVARADFASS